MTLNITYGENSTSVYQTGVYRMSATFGHEFNVELSKYGVYALSGCQRSVEGVRYKEYSLVYILPKVYLSTCVICLAALILCIRSSILLAHGVSVYHKEQVYSIKSVLIGKHTKLASIINVLPICSMCAPLVLLALLLL